MHTQMFSKYLQIMQWKAHSWYWQPKTLRKLMKRFITNLTIHIKTPAHDSLTQNVLSFQDRSIHQWMHNIFKAVFTFQSWMKLSWKTFSEKNCRVLSPFVRHPKSDISFKSYDYQFDVNIYWPSTWIKLHIILIRKT